MRQVETSPKTRYTDRVNPIYFDYNATTPPLPEVLACYRETAEQKWGNPSSLYRLGQTAKHALEAARRDIAKPLGADPRELFFTSGGSEAIAWAFSAIREKYRGEALHIVSSPTEHHAVLANLERLAKTGADIELLAVDAEGRTDLDELRRAIRPTTRLFAFMAANNETGLLHPVEAIGRIAREHGVLFFSDTVCAMGKIPLDFSVLPIDLAPFSSHKFHGPRGTGGLFARRGIALAPLIIGGAQEGGRRSGTENVAGAAASACAIGLVSQALAAEAARLSGLSHRLREGLTASAANIVWNTPERDGLPNTLNFSIPGLNAEQAAIALDLEGIALSTGSACTSGATNPSHVLLAMGRSPSLAKSALRISLGRFTTETEIDRFLSVFPPLIARLT